jgi:hypothetical protein
MGKVVKLVATTFKAFNFLLDCLQIWQFTGGGGMSAVIAAIITWYGHQSWWVVSLVAVATGVIVVIGLALIFKSFTAKTTEEKRLRKLPRLIYDIHKRICVIRNKTEGKMDWTSVRTNAKLPLLVSFVLGAEPDASRLGSIDEKEIEAMTDRVKKTRGHIHSGLPLLDTFMKDSGVDLATALSKDFRYKLLLAQLDTHKPYPNDTIRKDVQQITDASISFNYLLLFQLLLSDDERESPHRYHINT